MTDLSMRRAGMRDLDPIVLLLSDDVLGSGREDARLPANAAYRAAFEAIDSDTNQLLAVAEIGAEIVGCLQLTFVPGLSRQGMWRGQIESVRISSKVRGQGIGQRMFEWAIKACRTRGCGLVQLTTDKTRPDARRFYETLGFVASHEGMKLSLPMPDESPTSDG
ncbi:GNAT family N-acetyltransferase [Sagittula sp. NFXS13]